MKKLKNTKTVLAVLAALLATNLHAAPLWDNMNPSERAKFLSCDTQNCTEKTISSFGDFTNSFYWQPEETPSADEIEYMKKVLAGIKIVLKRSPHLELEPEVVFVDAEEAIISKQKSTPAEVEPKIILEGYPENIKIMIRSLSKEINQPRELSDDFSVKKLTINEFNAMIKKWSQKKIKIQDLNESTMGEALSIISAV